MMYLTAVIDLYSRKILSWRLSDSMKTDFCLECVKDAFEEYGVPAIFNTDCGSQYTSAAFVVNCAVLSTQNFYQFKV